jgi:predicted deacylase
MTVDIFSRKPRIQKLIRIAGLTTIILALCSACSTSITTNAPVDCAFTEVSFDTSFPGGRIDGCAEQEANRYLITLSPENTPINHSPWYAFKVEADAPRSITVELEYTEHAHRYFPKISTDGVTWERMPAADVTVAADGKQAVLSLQVGPNPIWVSAQELVDNDDYSAWVRQLAQQEFAQLSVLGKSLEGRDIYKINTFNQGQKKALLLVGRQHPPEVTGALAMRSFVERLFDSDALAQRFREQFGIIMVPNLNPDGVYHGNWRHNRNGVDLNRDWGPFSQPETQLMRDELSSLQQVGAPKPYLFLDFHSTAEDVFYTQFPDMKTFPENFTTRWMTAIEARAASDFPDYKVVWTPGHNAEEATSKNYMYETFGIPAITFELGDETDRSFIDQYAVLAAEEMMNVLLESTEH